MLAKAKSCTVFPQSLQSSEKCFHSPHAPIYTKHHVAEKLVTAGRNTLGYANMLRMKQSKRVATTGALLCL